MTWGIVAAVAGPSMSLVGGLYSADQAGKAAGKATKAEEKARAAAQALNEKRFAEAKQTLSPYLQSSKIANRQLMTELGLGDQYGATQQGQLSAWQQELDALQKQQIAPDEQVGTQPLSLPQQSQGNRLSPRQIVGNKINTTIAKNQAQQAKTAQSNEARIAELQGLIAEQSQPAAQSGAYMNSQAYKAATEAGISAVNTGASEAGALYSGARGTALRDVGQGVQQSFYNNYMNMLQNAANPAVATNISSLGMNQAANIGSQNMASTAQQNAYNLAGTEAKNAAVADITGGLGSAFSAYLNRPQSGTPRLQAGEPRLNPGQV